MRSAKKWSFFGALVACGIVLAPTAAMAGTTGIVFNVTQPAYSGWGKTSNQTKAVSNQAATVYVAYSASNARVCNSSGTCGSVKSGLVAGHTYSVSAPFAKGTTVHLELQNANYSSSPVGQSGNWASN